MKDPIDRIRDERTPEMKEAILTQREIEFLGHIPNRIDGLLVKVVP